MQGSGRFKCEMCIKTFKSGYDLRRHSVVHTREKPFACHLCGGRFTQIDSLRMHQKRVHQLAV